MYQCASLSTLSLRLRESSAPGLPPNCTSSLFPFPALAFALKGLQEPQQEAPTFPKAFSTFQSGELGDVCIVQAVTDSGVRKALKLWGQLCFQTSLDKLSHTNHKTVTNDVCYKEGYLLRAFDTVM